MAIDTRKIIIGAAVAFVFLLIIFSTSNSSQNGDTLPFSDAEIAEQQLSSSSSSHHSSSASSSHHSPSESSQKDCPICETVTCPTCKTCPAQTTCPKAEPAACPDAPHEREQPKTNSALDTASWWSDQEDKEFRARLMNVPRPRRVVALLAVSTGKYVPYALRMFKSALKFYMVDQDVHFFMFTDQDLPSSDHVHFVKVDGLKWPQASLLRANLYYDHRELWSKYGIEFIFATDSDMRFVDFVGSEILFDRVATLHPKFAHMAGSPDDLPYDRNPISRACIPKGQGRNYFAGGMYGGKTEYFVEMTRIMGEAIKEDLDKHNYIAENHDESHLNRYFASNPPIMALPPSYCYPEAAGGEYTYVKQLYPPKLVALDKDHASMRSG